MHPENDPDIETSEGARVPAPSARARVMVPAFFLLLLGGVVLAVVFFGVIPQSRARAALAADVADRATALPKVVQTKAVASPADLSISLPARLEAVQDAAIYPREGGYLKSVKADIGDRVKAGQVLAEVETPVLDQQIQNAAATVNSSEARVAAAKATSELSKISLDRLLDVKIAGAISIQTIDDAKTKARADEAALALAKAELESAKASARQLAERKTLATIVSPFDGEVTQRGYDLGALVIADKTDGTRAMFRVTNRDELRVFVELPQAAAIAVKEGQKVEVTVKEFGDRKFTGQVVRASAAIDSTTRTRLAEARIKNESHELLPGMFAQVALSVARQPRPVTVPAEALLFREGKTKIAVLDEKNALRYRDVTLGRDTGVAIEVLSGLSEGERVAVNLTRTIDEGTIVQPIDRSAK
jgi:RND family efflux transporter MFP subunit